MQMDLVIVWALSSYPQTHSLFPSFPCVQAQMDPLQPKAGRAGEEERAGPIAKLCSRAEAGPNA